MKLNLLVASASALAIVSAPSSAAATADKEGSLYVQCDGQPNNVTGAETAARLLGAVTLLGLFAPPPEAADASKRKFGKDGVAACSALIDGASGEGNPNRRVGLILGRAIHNIEAKEYDAALADVAKGREEATAAGLMANAYYARSRGRSFDEIESAILFRQGKIEEARAAALRNVDADRYSFWPELTTRSYGDYLKDLSPQEEKLLQAQVKLWPVTAMSYAARLDRAGRFVDSARIIDAYVEYDRINSPSLDSSSMLAMSALAHAMAGDSAVAAERAKAARDNNDKRVADGKPEANSSELVELLDLYGIVKLANEGDLTAARRLFSARSEWTAPSTGTIMAVSARLRKDAPAADLIGGLAKEPEQIWADKQAASRAQLLGKDGDNKTLFQMIGGESSAAAYRAVSKNVYRTDKSKMIIPRKAGAKDPMELMAQFGTPIDVLSDAYLLHAALLAQSRGHEGFIFMPILEKSIFAVSFRTGNRKTPGMPDALFIPASEVIASLRPIIPSPQELAKTK